MTVGGQSSPLVIKEAGNALFKAGKYHDALAEYQKALEALRTSVEQDEQERLPILKNISACYLKLEDYEKCVAVSNDVLEISKNDPKTLFRRCQAYEKLGRIEEAFQDARLVAHLQPADSTVQDIIARLSRKVEENAKGRASTDQKVTDMLAFFLKEPNLEKRQQAANNLIVLAREKSGAERLMDRKAPEMFVKLLKDKNLDPQIRLALVRTLGELLKEDLPRTKELLRNRIGLPPLLEMYQSDNEDLVTAVSVAIENTLRTLSGWIDKNKPDKNNIKENFEDIDYVLKTLVDLSDRAVLSAVGRDAIIDLVLKNVQENLSPGLAWTEQFMNHDGVGKFLTAAIVQPSDHIQVESSLLVTSETRVHVALALQKVYEDLDSDRKRKIFTDKCEEFVQRILVDPDPTTKIRAVLAIITLLQGPFDVGNFLLGTKGILEMLLAMANCDEDANQQLVAAEAIVHAASKKDKCTALAGDGLEILQRLANSTNENVQVRALVGLCKVGSSGGSDASNRPLSDPMIQHLSNLCRKYLADPSKSFDLKRWSAEGLAYLSLNADIKEAIVEDKLALRSLIDLGKTGNQNVVYGVISVFVNLTNCYDKQEVPPEMKELAQFAKQHIPLEHEKDSPEFVVKRVNALVEAGAVSALVALSKSESVSIRELISRVLNVIAERQEHRGIMVQQGAARALIKLALEGNPKGNECAAQALARIGITIDPQIAFPGQRSCEVVRPLLGLLDIEKSALQNFEALLALTNLAQLSESVRQRISKDGGLAKVEHYIYEEHEMLKRAATECICNLMISPEVQELFIKSESDRIKLLLLYSVDEDASVSLAASGALAMLSQDARTCEKIVGYPVWLDVMKESSVSENAELRKRSLFVLSNLMRHSQAAAEAVAGCELLEILMATSQLTGSQNEPTKALALKALKAAVKRKLIAPNPDYQNEEEDD